MDIQPVVEFKEIIVTRKGSQPALPTQAAAAVISPTPPIGQQSTDLPPAEASAAEPNMVSYKSCQLTQPHRRTAPSPPRVASTASAAARGSADPTSSPPPPLPRRRGASETSLRAKEPLSNKETVPSASLKAFVPSKDLERKEDGALSTATETLAAGKVSNDRSPLLGGGYVSSVDPSLGGLSGEDYVKTLPKDGRRSTQGIPEVSRIFFFWHL